MTLVYFWEYGERPVGGCVCNCTRQRQVDETQ